LNTDAGGLPGSVSSKKLPRCTTCLPSAGISIVSTGVFWMCSSTGCNNDNKVIDGAIDGLSKGTVATGRLTSLLHLGMIQYRLLTIFVVLVLLGIYFFF